MSECLHLGNGPWTPCLQTGIHLDKRYSPDEKVGTACRAVTELPTGRETTARKSRWHLILQQLDTGGCSAKSIMLRRNNFSANDSFEGRSEGKWQRDQTLISAESRFDFDFTGLGYLALANCHEFLTCDHRTPHTWKLPDLNLYFPEVGHDTSRALFDLLFGRV